MNILFVGLGGDGVVIAGRILARSASKKGMQIRVGEMHGLAQRGGTVTSHLRLGDDAKGVIIPKRKGDILIGFEPLETLREFPAIKDGGCVIMNTQSRLGWDFFSGKSTYPSEDEIKTRIQKRATLATIDATKIALELGSSKYTNIVMLGALVASGRSPVDRETLLKTIEENVPAHSIEMNRKAFELGEKSLKPCT